MAKTFLHFCQLLGECGHTFHYACIDQHMAAVHEPQGDVGVRTAKCPNCQVDIIEVHHITTFINHLEGPVAVDD